MPSEFLVAAQGNAKGQIVNVRPAGWQWGSEETLPKFVQVEVTDGWFADAREWIQAWRRHVDMAVLSNTDTDAVVQFSADLVRESDGAGKVSQVELQDLIDFWSMTVNNDGDNAVECSVNLFAAAISFGFWGIDLSVATFTNLGVVNGIQRLEMDYSETGWSSNVVGAQIAKRRCEVVSNDGAVVRFGVPIIGLRDALIEDLRGYRRTISQRRYAMVESAIDSIIGAGGRVSVTEAQVNSNIIDLTAM